MTVWRHTGGHHHLATRPDPCTCITPQPDLDSPCGFTLDGCEGWYAHQSWNETSEEPGAQCAHEPREDCHPHVPTLYLHYGHGLEAA